MAYVFANLLSATVRGAARKLAAGFSLLLRRIGKRLTDAARRASR